MGRCCISEIHMKQIVIIITNSNWRHMSSDIFVLKIGVP